MCAAQYYYQPYDNQIINGDTADFPLCFPNGFPANGFDEPCYLHQNFPDAYQGSLPCLPPMINGLNIVPCQGPYVVITSYNS